MNHCLICLQCVATEDNPMVSVRETNSGEFGCSCDGHVHLKCIERWHSIGYEPRCILCNSTRYRERRRRSCAFLFCCAGMIGSPAAAAVLSFESLVGIRNTHVDPYFTLLPI